MPVYEDGDKEYPITGQSRAGTQIAWSVEVRYDNLGLKKINDNLTLDNRWRSLPVYFVEKYGIPAGNCLFREANYMDLLSYQAAQALRWGFLADLESNDSALCVETRLVKHRVSHRIECKEIGHCETISTEDRKAFGPEGMEAEKEDRDEV